MKRKTIHMNHKRNQFKWGATREKRKMAEKTNKRLFFMKKKNTKKCTDANYTHQLTSLQRQRQAKKIEPDRTLCFTASFIISFNFATSSSYHTVFFFFFIQQQKWQIFISIISPKSSYSPLTRWLFKQWMCCVCLLLWSLRR